MHCPVCQADRRPLAHFCHRCGFPQTAPHASQPVVRDLRAIPEQDVAAEPLLAPLLAHAANDLLDIHTEVLRRFTAEARLLVRLTERFLDADPAPVGGLDQLLALERAIDDEWRRGTLTLRRLAAVEQRLGIRTAVTELTRRRARLMLKLELDDARLACWLALAGATDPATDAVLDRLTAALEQQAAELEEIRARLATLQ